MKLLAFVVVFATLGFLTTAQDATTCSDEMQAAAENVVEVCGPILRWTMKKHHKEEDSDVEHNGHDDEEEHEGHSDEEEEHKGHSDEQESNTNNSEFINKRQECLESIEAEAGFQGLVNKCKDVEKKLKCILGEFKKECSDFKLPDAQLP